MDLGSSAGASAQASRQKRQDIVKYEGKMSYTTSAKPLDFSFMKIQNVNQLKKEEARDGRRKEIVLSEDEEDNKKNDNGLGAVNEENAHEEQKQAAQQEKVIRAPQNQQINNILSTYNISLQGQAKAGPGRKVEETKTETKKKIVVNSQTTALFLQNNEIRTVVDLPVVLYDVMYNSENLLWLDLSYNYLEQIDQSLLEFKQLKTLYLHGNYIQNLEEAEKLNGFQDLQSLTLFGNPIETIKNYRLWILGVMYTYNENLRKLDQVVVTNREFDKVLVWKERTQQSKFKRLRKLKPEVAKSAPAPAKSEDEEKKQSSQ